MERHDLPTWIWTPALALVLVAWLHGAAQAVVIPWIGPDLGDWNAPANWQDGLIFGLPNGGADEAAGINNNTTAVLSASASTTVGGILLGQTAGTSGGLRITNGGSLTSAAAFAETGGITVGGAGQGTLTILGGGSLSGTSLILGGGVGSSMTLGDTSGLTATLSASGNATLNRTTHVTGRFVNFSVGGNLTMSSTSTLVSQINHASLFSPLKSSGTANVGGTLKVEFLGVTPTVGSAWTIVDATSINGSFSTLDASAAPALPVGQTYRVKRATGGNGQLLQLTVAQVLSLKVDRVTGAVSIANNGANPQTIDGYSISSSYGALTGNWNSLTNQSTSGWVEAETTQNALGEFHPQAGGTPVTAADPLELGSPYQPVYPAFGVDPDHLEFEYSTPDGEVFTGVVEYTGAKINNNLVVNVNTTTGQAQLKNDSPFTIRIDGYSVFSESGSLQPAAGKWFSLQDRGIGGWEEAFPLTTAVAELNSDGGLTLSPFSGYDLGELYKSVGGTPDLDLEFILDGEDLPVAGKVVYGAFGPVSPPGLAGDFNGNGKVDAADYTVWRNNLGAPTETAINGNGNGINGIDPGDYNVWKSNFGSMAGSGSVQTATTSVPEPATGVLLLIVALFSACSRSVWNTLSGLFAWRSAVLPLVAGAVLLCITSETLVAQTVLFKDDFDGDAVPAPGATPEAGANVGAPWGVNAISPTTYQSTANPFPTGNFYADLTDPGPSASPSQALRLQSNAGNDTALESSLNGQVTTFSFELFEPTRSGDVNAMMFGYYRQQANPDLNGAGRSYTSTLHDGLLNPQGPLLSGAAVNYSLDTVHTVYMFANDSASAVTNYAGSGRTLADTSADVWISLAGAAPTYAFTVDRQNAVAPNDTPVSGIGFRTFNADIERFLINNVLLVSGTSFDRSAFAGPCGLGDVNCDGTIDLENDFEAIRTNFRLSGASRDSGDLTADGIVTLLDYVQWKTAFLSGGGSLDGINLTFLSVPEPSSALMIASVITGMASCRIRRRRASSSKAVDAEATIGVLLQKLMSLAVAIFGIAISATTASAELKVYEGFNYPNTTSILGGNGGGGWSDVWTKTGNAASSETATTPGLTYQTVPATGNKLTLAGQQAAGTGNSSFSFRSFQTDFGADGTTTWISLMGQRTGVKSGTDGVGDTPSYQRVFGAHFFNAGNTTTDERFSIGELSSAAAIDDVDRWGLNVFNADPLLAVIAPSTTPIDQQAFLLVRVDFNAGTLTDHAYLWVNPNLAAGEPSIGTAQASLLNRNLEFDRVRLSAGGSLGTTGEIATASGVLDELRIGTTFASVIGVGLIPGDVTGNGIADINDYHVIRDHFNTSGSRANGDLNGDGRVNLVDFRLWKASRTAGAGSEFIDGPLGAVPEPATCMLLLIAGGLISSRRRPHNGCGSQYSRHRIRKDTP